MAKDSFSSEHDQYDPKVFRETLGSFGTTTKPGENQLKELQTKVRQGVKHVELHLAGEGKGQFNVQDVPDKYGFEQRRTIMQLAKLNKQTLSVHGTFNINSFAGLGNGGFEESQRANNIKEIDETVKFAAETAKEGAIVFHLHETQLRTPPGELNLPRQYLEKLKNSADPEKRKEYKKIMKDYLDTDNFNRTFLDNPDLPKEMRIQYDELEKNPTKEFLDFKERYKDKLDEAERTGKEKWKVYYERDNIERIKNTDQSLVVVGNSLSRVNRNNQVLNLDENTGELVTIDKRPLSKEQQEYLTKKGIKNTSKLSFDSFQELRALLLNGSEEKEEDKQILESLKGKYLWNYDKMLESKENMRYEADRDFFKLQNLQQIKAMKLQKEELKMKHQIHKEALDQLGELEDKQRTDLDKIRELSEKSNPNEQEKALKDALKSRLQERNQRMEQIKFQAIGQSDYAQLAQYNERIAETNEKISEIEKKNENAKVLTDEIFYKNASAMGDLGIKAMKYQLDLKQRAEVSAEEKAKAQKEIDDLQKAVDRAKTSEERDRNHRKLQKAKYDMRLKVGLEDYKDIDVINKPLYLAPENIMAGYGYMDSLEEYKAVIRESWEEFAKKLTSNEPEYKKIRENYEKVTGKKVTKDNAREVAKRHIAGTFDNAHAGVWLKYFKREGNESEEERIRRFNKWLNDEAEDMVKEGIVKHFHFNDTQAKDDDHNLLGSGILDIHDWRDRLRKAGVQEALIVEAGGRGAADNLHLRNAFEIFNPELFIRGELGERQYRLNEPVSEGSEVSDWVTVRRAYEQRVRYSDYGMSYNSFRHQAPKEGPNRGGWSGTGFFS